MGEGRIPVFVAVGLWVASGLAVMTYTVIAFRETANGLESGAMDLAAAGNPLVAGAGILAAETVAPKGSLRRGKFN